MTRTRRWKPSNGSTRLRLGAISRTNRWQEFNKSSNLKTLMMNLFFYGFLTLITLIGVTNIVNTLDTNIKLRRREIAMLKSVGLTPGGLLRMLCYESLFYGLTALLSGLPLGIALSVFIYYQFDGVSTFAFTLPWGAILACIAGILAIVFATMMVSGSDDPQRQHRGYDQGGESVNGRCVGSSGCLPPRRPGRSRRSTGSARAC